MALPPPSSGVSHLVWIGFLQFWEKESIEARVEEAWTPHRKVPGVDLSLESACVGRGGGGGRRRRLRVPLPQLCLWLCVRLCVCVCVCVYMSVREQHA